MTLPAPAQGFCVFAVPLSTHRAPPMAFRSLLCPRPACAVPPCQRPFPSLDLPSQT